MPSLDQVAWAAGLFEGEGTFSFSQQRARASMASTDEDVLRRFVEVVGVGGVGHIAPRKPHHKPAWQWWANGEDAEAVFELIGPWLGERRLARGRAVIKARVDARTALAAERPCANCGGLFMPRSTRAASKARYCSDDCLKAAKNERRRNRAVFRPERIKLPEDEA